WDRAGGRRDARERGALRERDEDVVDRGLLAGLLLEARPVPVDPEEHRGLRCRRERESGECDDGRAHDVLQSSPIRSTEWGISTIAAPSPASRRRSATTVS